MKPIQFRYANRELGAPPGDDQYPEGVLGIDPLPVWTNGAQCTSCWQLSFRERLSALLFGRVWLAILSGESQPPVFLEASRRYFQEVDKPRRCYLRGPSPLGLFNTVAGCLFNRVLVRCVDQETGKTVSWYWDKATDHPPEEG